MGFKIDCFTGRAHFFIPEGEGGGSGGGGDATVYGALIPTDSSTTLQKVKLESGALTAVDSFDYTPCHYWKGCVRDIANKETAYYLNSNDWSLKKDGTQSDLSGADGDVVVHIEKFFTLYGTVHNGTYAGRDFILCSRVRFMFEGETADYDPAFSAANDTGVAEDLYHYAYEAVLCDSAGAPKVTNRYATGGGTFATGDRARSISGGHVWTNADQGKMEQAFQNNGCHGANWQIEAMIARMMLVYMGNRHMQGTSLGAGMAYAKEWKYEYARMTGRSNYIGNGCGSVTASQGITVAITGNSEASGTYAISTESATFSDRVWTKGNYSIKASGTPGTSTTAWAVYDNTDTAVVTSTDAAGSPAQCTWPTGTTMETMDAEIVWTSSAVSDSTLRTVGTRFLGIENFYGNINKFQFGLYRMKKNDVDGICFTTKASEHATSVSAADSGTQLYDNWQAFTWPSSANYIKTIDLRTCLPLTVGAGTTTYYADYFYRWSAANEALARFVIRGGSAPATTYTGPFCVYASNSVAGAGASVGGFGSAA